MLLVSSLSFSLAIFWLAGYDVGVRNELLLAVGAFYLFSYRTVGLRIDGNPCPYLLSPPAPAPYGARVIYTLLCCSFAIGECARFKGYCSAFGDPSFRAVLLI